jgi:hypothetical protein
MHNTYMDSTYGALTVWYTCVVLQEGLVALAIEGSTAVVVEVNSETDFVARNADFQVTRPTLLARPLLEMMMES